MSSRLVSDPKLATRFMTRSSRFTVVLIATILLGTALFSASSAHKKNGDRVKSASATIDVRTIVSDHNSARLINKFLGGNGVTEARAPLSALLPQTPPQPETIATYAADCSTPKSSFILGEVACAKLSGGPSLSIYPRKITWVDTDNNILQSVNVTTDPQTNLFTIPVISTSTDFRGVWRVNDISAARSSVRTSAFFDVSNPALPAADLSVYKGNDTNGTITAGSNIAYVLFLSNKGPDAASNVTFTDNTPANTTFVGAHQDSGPTLTCTFPSAGGTGTTTCTLATFNFGSSAKLTLVYNVNSGTAADTIISNTGNISSETPDPHDSSNTPPPFDPNADPSNNTATSRTMVVAGAAGATCTLVCPDNITTNANTTVNGQRGAYVTFAGPEPTGDCGALTSDHASGSFFPDGTTTVTYTSETGGGSCSFNIIVNDVAGAPTITCPSNKTASADSTCHATVDPGTPTTTGDNVTVTSKRSDDLQLSDPYPVGQTTITWTATNSSGSASCQQTITVSDTTPPTITCPANITQANDPGQCSATVNPGTATATDNCDSNVLVTGARGDGQPLNVPYPKGTTTITWTATDDSNNTSSCTQTVTVNDTEKPVITCPADITQSTDPGQCSASVNPGTATATDNCDSPTVNGTRSDGQALNAPYPKGATTITWTATDGSGNSSSCTQTVTVNDTEKPAITCPANITHGTDPGACSATFDPGTATATDNCGNPSVSGTRSDGQPLNAAYPKGATTITWTATDGSGNSSSCAQTVTVNDTEAPKVTCPNNVTTVSPTGSCSATVNVGVATATDNCDGNVTPVPSRSDNKPITDPFPVGTTTITWTATDSSGNHSSCDQTVTVVDNQKPVISCPANITRSTDPGSCSATIDPGRATATDNCDPNPTVTGTRSARH